jgi:hypothetical protein
MIAEQALRISETVAPITRDDPIKKASSLKDQEPSPAPKSYARAS